MEKFGMENAKPSWVPMEQTFRVTEEMINNNTPPERVKKFQSIMGCLTFLSIWTRLDIGYSLNLLLCYLTRPSESLIKAAKKIVAYLKYTRTLGLQFAQCCDYDDKWKGLVTVRAE
eukprot:221262-Rhodomonas_salina.2